MNDNEITFINGDEIIKPIDTSQNNSVNNNNNNYSQQSAVGDNDVITLPDWDLTPPFDSIDRGDML